MTTIDLEEVKIKLYHKLKTSGWADVLKTFILSNDFDKILQELLRQSQDGKKFTPIVKYLFRAFEECPYDKTSVIILGQDPYPTPNVADGIAFSCSIDNYVQPSLRFIHNEIQDTVYPNEVYNKVTDLKNWSNQGVLLINTAFTTTVNKVGSHYKLWEPFMSFLLDILQYDKPELIYAFLGKKAQEWSVSIPETNHKFLITHPASAAHNKLEKWDSSDVFNKINTCLVRKGKQAIIW
jgi:uracil-DNA glycosylase